MKLAGFGEHNASIFKVTSCQTLGRLLAPATNRKVQHQAQLFLHWCKQRSVNKSHRTSACFRTVTYTKTIVSIMMPSYTVNEANFPCEEGWYVSPRCSCTVTYAFYDSFRTLLITCHHTVKNPIYLETFSCQNNLTIYCTTLTRTISICLHITHMLFPAQSRIFS